MPIIKYVHVYVLYDAISKIAVLILVIFVFQWHPKIDNSWPLTFFKARNVFPVLKNKQNWKKSLQKMCISCLQEKRKKKKGGKKKKKRETKTKPWGQKQTLLATQNLDKRFGDSRSWTIVILLPRFDEHSRITRNK